MWEPCDKKSGMVWKYQESQQNLVTNKKPQDQSLGVAVTSVTPGTSVGVTSPQTVKKHHGWSSQEQYPKRPQGGNVISQVCLLAWLLPFFLFVFMPSCLWVPVLFIFWSFSDFCILPLKLFPAFCYLPNWPSSEAMQFSHYSLNRILFCP